MDKTSCSFSFCIGGVGFNVTTDGLLLPEHLYPNHSYSFFTSSRPGTVFYKTDIIITASDPPDLSHAKWLFGGSASVSSWSSCTNDGFIYVKLAGLSNRPAWIAQFPADASRVTIFCGNEMIDAGARRLIFNPVAYPLDQILLMYRFAGRGAICHGAGWTANGAGFVFAGVSGAGKTTISNLLAQNKAGFLLSDDRVIIVEDNEKFYVYGTPWPGEGGYAQNMRIPLDAVFFLTRGDESKIESISPAMAASLILPVLSIPWYDAEITGIMLDFCDRLVSRVPAYYLAFTLEL